jgi:hypothetical protein
MFCLRATIWVHEGFPRQNNLNDLSPSGFELWSPAINDVLASPNFLNDDEIVTGGGFQCMNAVNHVNPTAIAPYLWTWEHHPNFLAKM